MASPAQPTSVEKRERARTKAVSELSPEIQDIIRSYKRNPDETPKLVKLGFQATAIVLLLAVSSSLAQLTLSPVYGSIWASRYYLLGLRLALLLGWATRKRYPQLLSAHIGNYLPVIAALIPLAQLVLFQQSERMGLLLGPLVSHLTTYWLLAFVGSSALAQILEIDGLCPGTMGFVASYFSYHNLTNSADALLKEYIGYSAAVTRVPLQMIVAAGLAISFPSRWVLVLIPSMLLTANFDIHAPFDLTTERLGLAIADQGFSLVERRESNTGYLSVLDSRKDHFRVMRCDHSLLGGEWTNTKNDEYPYIKDPTFAVFAMLEAVRLVQPDDGKTVRSNGKETSLVIGLGIGTTPAALATHGINTTVVEIDSAIVDLARAHFHLPKNNLNIVVEDAEIFVDKALDAKTPAQYDYIIHDVFSGGVEPSALFTQEFLTQLRLLLREDGVIAINYAGDLQLPPAGLVVRTIQSVFPSCRVFREGEPTESSDNDLTNLVIFCKRSATPLKFRKAVETDYLGSLSRRSYLQPRIEVDAATFAPTEDAPVVLTEENTEDLSVWHPQSAASHWKLMRSVLPPQVWQSW